MEGCLLGTAIRFCPSITFSPRSNLCIAFGSSRPARLLYQSRRMLKTPFGIDSFGQDFGGHLSELLRRAVEALLVAQLVLAGFLAGLHGVLLHGLVPVAGAPRPHGDDRGANACTAATTANNSALLMGENIAMCFPKDANWNVTPVAAPSWSCGRLCR